MNLLLKNCRIVVNGKEFLKHISVVMGRIEKIITHDAKIIPDRKTRVIDIDGRYVIPGVIDAHVHFREPGLEHKEDFYTGSKAAVKGGVTTFLDMPNTLPPTATIDALEKKRVLARKSIANYGFHFGVTAESDISAIKAAQNVASTKLYMDETTGNLLITDKERIKDTFKNSRMVSAHAEGGQVKNAIAWNRDHGKGLYLCHISQASEIEEIKLAKADQKGRPVYAEVTPHHLYLTQDIDKDNFTKMKPCLKSQADKEALWKAINEGIVDTVGSDHAPHTVEEKKGGKICYGVPGVETLLPLMLNAVNTKLITMQRLIELCCNRPADIFRIRNKGYLKDGYDADLVVIDMELEKKIENSEILSKCKWTPFYGMVTRGWPVMTIIAGTVMYENGKVNTDMMGREVEYR